MKTPWDIHYEAFSNTGGIYTEKHAKLYADLVNELMASGNFSITYEGVAHACYTPIILNKAPHLNCWFARELTSGVLEKVGATSTSVSEPYANPIMWMHPDEQV